MTARATCGFAALMGSPGKRKAVSPACPQGLKNPANSRRILHNSTAPTTARGKKMEGGTAPSAKRQTLIAGGSGIGGTSVTYRDWRVELPTW